MVLTYRISLFFNYIHRDGNPGKLRLVVAPTGLSHLVVECLSEVKSSKAGFLEFAGEFGNRVLLQVIPALDQGVQLFAQLRINLVRLCRRGGVGGISDPQQLAEVLVKGGE